MPRILPRLRQAWDSVRDKAFEAKPVPPRTPPRPYKTGGRRLPAESALASLSIHRRTESLLLDKQNAVQRRREYRYKRAQAPRVYGPGLVSPRPEEPDFGGSTARRRMTKEEREWWSSPYLRMLASPLRECVLLHKLIPRDFMIRLAAIRTSAPRATRMTIQTFVPDGMEHLRFKQRRGRKGFYLACNKAAYDLFAKTTSAYKRLIQNVALHPQLGAQIGHILRVRVLQELSLLADRLQTRPRNATDHPVMRRLTRAEWKQIKETGIIPFEGAAAVLVVPPLNKDPKTKQRPKPHTTSDPESENTEPQQSLTSSELEAEGEGTEPQQSTAPSELKSEIEEDEPPPERELPPVSTLHLTAPKQVPVDAAVRTVQYLPPAKVPLYNGLSLFPSRGQRAALYEALNRVLAVERKARWRGQRPKQDTDGASGDEAKVDKWARGDQKASHAYVLFSDNRTVCRADSVPLAIALWRIRLWEGEGWQPNPNSRRVSSGGWVITKPIILR